MRVNSIQCLRAAAALLVVYEHSMDVQIKFGTSWQQKFYHLNNFGCIGVDLFFVISGFIIMYSANKYIGTNEGFQFLENRFFRINPVYYIVTILYFGFLLLKSYFNHFPIPDKTIYSLVDSLVIIPISGNIDLFTPLLIVGWTLSFEWLFYLIFFILILCKVNLKIVFFPCLILALVSLGLLLKPNDLRLQFITNPVMLEFALGVIICRLYCSSVNIPVWIGATFLAVGLIGYLLLIRFGYGNIWHYLNVITGKSGLNKFLLWGLPSGCLVAGCVFLEKHGHLNKIFDNRLALLLGNASYSIYLIHYIIFNVFTFIFFKTKFFWQGDIMIWLQIIIALYISILFYKLVENPLILYLHNKKSKTNIIKENIKKVDESKEMIPT